MLAETSTPAPYQRAERSRAEIAAELGVSTRHLRRLLARERQQATEPDKAEWARPREERLDRFDYPYMELADRPLGDRAYCTAEGRSNRESGKYHVGGQVQSLRFGRVAKDEDLTDDLTNATSYQPDPDGLKGGVG